MMTPVPSSAGGRIRTGPMPLGAREVILTTDGLRALTRATVVRGGEVTPGSFGVGVSVGSAVGVGVNEGAGVAVGDGVGIWVGIAVGDGVAVAVGKGVGERVGVAVGRDVGDGLGVAVGTRLGVGEMDSDSTIREGWSVLTSTVGVVSSRTDWVGVKTNSSLFGMLNGVGFNRGAATSLESEMVSLHAVKRIKAKPANTKASHILTSRSGSTIPFFHSDC